MEMMWCNNVWFILYLKFYLVGKREYIEVEYIFDIMPYKKKPNDRLWTLNMCNSVEKIKVIKILV